MAESVWWNGEIVSADTVRIGIRDRGFLLGEGVFETMLVVRGHLWKASYHAQRLQCGLEGLGIPAHFEEAALHHLAAALSRALGMTEGVLRLSVSAGEGGRGLSPVGQVEPLLLATLDPLPGPLQVGIAVVTSAYRRVAGDPSTAWKTLSWLPMVQARREALAAGADEGLLLNQWGEPCCFASGNLLLWNGQAWQTPGADAGALPGTTLSWLHDRGMAGMTLHQGSLDAVSIREAEGVYLINTVSGLVPVDRIDGRHYRSRELPAYAALRRFLEAERGKKLP